MVTPSTFGWAAFGGYLMVVLLAAARRGRFYAIFVGIMLGIQTAILATLGGIFYAVHPVLLVVAGVLHLTVLIHFASLTRPKMRPTWWRLLITWPAHAFAAGTLLSFINALLCIVIVPPLWLVAIPYALGLVGLHQSLYTRDTERDIVVGDGDVGKLRPVRGARPTETRVSRPLRIVQITDPHLGPYMSEARLRRIAERAVAKDPDLVLLTGDFLTMESHTASAILGRALEPLRALEGRVFACHGNHDHEARSTVAKGLAAAGISLLIDEEALVETPAGQVQIIGADYRFRKRAEHLAGLAERFPRANGALRVWLLHDPGAFKHVPEGESDLALAGHTHGGQLGVVTRWFSWTPVWNLVGMPDHGLFARGVDRLYVHRGTGVYGFPVRLGVPAEESLVRVHNLAG